MVDKQSAIESLSGVGPQTLKKLAKLRLYSIRDLLLHMPYRYEHHSRLTAIPNLIDNETCVVEGIVCHQKLGGRRRQTLEVTVQDEQGYLLVRFFNFRPYFAKQFQQGRRIRCTGVPKYKMHRYEMVHPAIVWLDKPTPLPNHYVACYHLTEGLNQNLMRGLIQQVFRVIDHKPTLYDSVNQPDYGFWQAVEHIHYPPLTEDMDAFVDYKSPYHQRLIVEEIYLHHLITKYHRSLSAQKQTITLTEDRMSQKFIHALPFELTADQQQVIKEIQADLASSEPMLRLLQGDVGCGKTVVAIAAMLVAVQHGKQAIFMAPTELLAQQHYQNINALLEPLGVQSLFLSGALTAKQRRQALEQIPTADILIGTHAFLHLDAPLDRLALIVIDEQHRFGVEQRLALSQKTAHQPHQLIMSATPIPRSLAMTLYGDLELSVIHQLPVNRKPIQTSIINLDKYESLVVKINQNILEGKQVYWVCPLIETSEHIAAQDVETRHADLQTKISGTVALIHGRLKPQEKLDIMLKFNANAVSLLVSTTVIEVGVDVPNASIIVIENPERLGLAQLHQLRGRVGRGHIASHCILLYREPLSEASKMRLEAIRAHSDGFKLAEIDLSIRDAGDLLGTRQTGDQQFHLANISRDYVLFEKTKVIADQLWAQNPEAALSLIKEQNDHAGQFINA